MAGAGLSCSRVRAVEFLEPWAHLVLYLRRVYPAALFESCWAYGVPVHRCVEPTLRDYVAHAVAGCREWLVQRTLERVGIVIYDGSTRVEAHCVSFRSGTPGALDTASQWRQFFRGALVGLAHECASLRPLPADCEFQFEFVTEAVVLRVCVCACPWLTTLGLMVCRRWTSANGCWWKAHAARKPHCSRTNPPVPRAPLQRKRLSASLTWPIKHSPL